MFWALYKYIIIIIIIIKSIIIQLRFDLINI